MNNTLDFIIDDGVLTKYVGTAEQIVIPSGVQIIGGGAFGGSRGIRSVAIPDTVTRICDGAFSLCMNLEHVTLPPSLRSIGNGAFSGCFSIREILLPEGLERIGDDAFTPCYDVLRVSIPATLTHIGRSAFQGCNNAETLCVSEGNTVYHADCGCLIETASGTLIFGTKNAVIPPDGSVRAIGYGAFCECDAIKEIVIPDCVTKIGEYAFCGCEALGHITLPATLTEIPRGKIGRAHV